MFTFVCVYIIYLFISVCCNGQTLLYVVTVRVCRCKLYAQIVFSVSTILMLTEPNQRACRRSLHVCVSVCIPNLCTCSCVCAHIMFICVICVCVCMWCVSDVESCV